MLWLKVIGAGSFFAALAVGLGAFGAHYLKTQLDPSRLAIFETGVRYQMYHALGLILLGLLLSKLDHGAFKAAAGCFTLGTVLFSGSLYALAFNPLKWLGPLTPLGGALFISGWLCCAWGAFSI